ncbi:MAG: hypothetical protein JWM98_1445 [Thermoleophilia bacterium]|nr:hypothetical protein [Thermoleophilia bacterium]
MTSLTLVIAAAIVLAYIASAVRGRRRTSAAQVMARPDRADAVARLGGVPDPEYDGSFAITRGGYVAEVSVRADGRWAQLEVSRVDDYDPVAPLETLDAPDDVWQRVPSVSWERDTAGRLVADMTFVRDAGWDEEHGRIAAPYLDRLGAAGATYLGLLGDMTECNVEAVDDTALFAAIAAVVDPLIRLRQASEARFEAWASLEAGQLAARSA